MPHDLHGLPITTTPEAGAAFDRTVLAYLKYKVDAPEHLKRTLATDAEFALAHCLKGYFAMLAYNQARVPAAAEAARIAREHSTHATPRERAHVDALEAWIAGDLDRMLCVWEQILAEHSTDVLALRLAHFNNFWLGRPREMAASVERVRPKWGRELPGYGTLLSCRAFALEECGDYAGAEPAGRAAVEIDPGDVWGTHAVAHIMEMQGRHQEGIALLDQLERHWVGGNNLLHHLWWHRALFHLERGEHAEVLALYDRRFRDLASPLTQAQPDLYIDVQNAASMLFRLERRGVDVGARWNEIADKAEARIGDCLSAFTLPHWMMALAATGREQTAARLLEGMRAFAQSDTTTGKTVGEVALPICAAVLAHRRGEPARAVALMRPVLADMHRLGGSHAQQDVLEQFFLDAAIKADSADDVRLLLARVKRHPVPPHARAGYAEAAKAYLH
jgi:tetratricopeptide (TPR) repeat protein